MNVASCWIQWADPHTLINEIFKTESLSGCFNITSFTIEFWFNGATEETQKRLRVLTFSMTKNESEFKIFPISGMSIRCSGDTT